MSTKRCFAAPPPRMELEKLTGLLVVIEGPDSSGRSTQIAMLGEWLEQQGHAVTQVGLRRSPLVGPHLEVVKRGNVLSPRTLSLFYATDFYDQLENTIVPALASGHVVVADRYVYTLMARDIVRGADPEWVESLYSRAIVPDRVFLFQVSLPTLIERTFQAHSQLDYWESGMDLGLSRDWFDSFVRYQRKMRAEFRRLQRLHGFETINANRDRVAIDRELRNRVGRLLEETQRAPPRA